jgi:hypothetical protein
MDYENMKNPINVVGILAGGTQFDLEVTIPEDKRDVIYGIIKDCYKEPVNDAVVKLIEVCYRGKEEYRLPVSHTFTDDEGRFVFGPLCPDRSYEIQIWANNVKHKFICARVTKDTDCLKGKKEDCKCEEHKCDREDNKIIEC